MSKQYDLEKLNLALEENSRATEAALEAFFSQKSGKGSLGTIKDAQMYSALGGGKRIRPFLVNHICKILGGSEEASMPLAIAVEMVHTYSLIHDDLPCMDNDDMRRGKPTNHRVFGEANAVLAGDALLTNAFFAATSGNALDGDRTALAVRLISDAAGDRGMIGGQVTDIEGESKSLSLEEMLELHSMKTGRLIELSAALGCIAAGYGEDTEEYSAATAYARNIGLAFQAVDDLLDVIGDEAALGKPIASDKNNGKTTFLTFMDTEGVRAYAKRLTEQAVAEIERLPDSEVLTALAVYLLNRNK